MVARFKPNFPTDPDYRILRGCWNDTGTACRIWYIQNGRVRMTFSEGMLSYQVDKAIRTQPK